MRFSRILAGGAACFAAGLGSAGTAQAATIGSTFFNGSNTCPAKELDADTQAVIPGAGGRITSFSYAATSNPSSGTQIVFKVLRKVGGSQYLVVGSSPVENLTPGTTNTFPLASPIVVKGGDVLGLYNPSSKTVAQCAAFTGAVPGQNPWAASVTAADQGSIVALNQIATARLNLSAQFEPVQEVVKGQGVSKIGTAFSLSVTKTAQGLIGGHLKFENAKYSPALREGDVTCARFGTKRAVIGIVDRANETHRGDVYREFYVEDEPKGFRLTGLLSSSALPAAGAPCRKALPKANTGGLIRSGSMTFSPIE